VSWHAEQIKKTAAVMPGGVITADKGIEARDSMLQTLLVGELLPEASARELRRLIPANSSLHHPSLRPSERMALDQADAVIWLGAELEPGFVRYMEQVPSARLITVSDIAVLQLINLAPGNRQSARRACMAQSGQFPGDCP
jgi:hypothetical protein